jgi:hypothetical protein
LVKKHTLGHWAGLTALAALAAGCEPETPRPPGPNEACFELRPGLRAEEQEQYCAPQLCFPKEKRVSEQNPQASGFKCDVDKATCDVPPLKDQNGAPPLTTFYYHTQDAELSLGFDSHILLGYSLDNFRKYFLGAQMLWNPYPNASAMYMQGESDLPNKAEIVAYADGIIHARFEGYARNTLFIADTPPHFCRDLSSGNPICSIEGCEYSDEPGGNDSPVHLVVDVEIPIQQPTP